MPVKHTFEIVLGTEMPPEEIAEISDVDAHEEPNGRTFLILGEMRAGVVVDDEVPATDREAQKKAVRTAAFFFKQDNPDWADAPLVGLDVQLSRSVFLS